MEKSCQWLRVNQSIEKGITVINVMDDTKFEPFLYRVVSSISLPSTEIFTEQEQTKLQRIFKADDSSVILAIKTIHYIVRRMFKYVFKPAIMKKDLNWLGLCETKVEIMVKIWCSETSSVMGDSSKLSDDSLKVNWKLNAELSSGICKKAKVPKANIQFNDEKNLATEMELTHNEVYNMFLQFEAIQTELDTLM